MVGYGGWIRHFTIYWRHLFLISILIFTYRSTTSWLAPKFSNCPSSTHATGAIWLSNVRCKGTESSLDQCSSLGWGKVKKHCDHVSDVCLVCDNSQYHNMGELRLSSYKQRIKYNLILWQNSKSSNWTKFSHWVAAFTVNGQYFGFI